jgi:hypothetical protein
MDAGTGKALPGATVSFINGSTVLGTLTSDSGGKVSFEGSDNPSYLDYNTMIQASMPGYSNSGITGNLIDPTWFFWMAPASSASVLPYIVAGAGLALGAAYLLKKKHGRVGAEGGPAEKTDYAKYIIPVGLVAVAYFVVKSITNTLGLTETADQKAQREASQNALTSTANASYSSAPPTQSDAVWSAAADEIYSDLSGSVPLLNMNSPSDAAAILATAKNTSDVLKIIQFFGTRSQTLFGIPGPNMTLPQFVRSATGSLSSDQIAALNAQYTAAGINWQW